jgi:2-haloacid dehalogenase
MAPTMRRMNTVLTPAIRAVVFDAYGTLFDVHSAVMRHAEDIGPEARAFSELWRAKQLEYTWVRSLIGRYRDFWALTVEALDVALARHPGVAPRLRQPLLDAYRTLAAYPEAPAALTALRSAGLKTAILSNGAPGMLADAVGAAGLGGLLDAVLSVHSLGHFKPPTAAYAPVGDALGVRPNEVLFVSSNRWDIAGAAAFGFRTAWVNRAGLTDEYDDLPPDAVIANLDGLRAPRA